MRGGTIGLYIVFGLIVVIVVALLFYKVKMGRQDRANSRRRKDEIEKNIKDTKPKT